MLWTAGENVSMYVEIEIKIDMKLIDWWIKYKAG